MNVIQIEGMEGLGYHSGIGANATATETEDANWLSHGRRAGSIV